MSAKPRYRIGAVARLTGVSTHALRIWERRYGTVCPERSASGDRLYSDDDVLRLRQIKRLLALGHAIGDVAQLSNAELSRLLDLHGGIAVSQQPGAGTVERYLSHVERMDMAAAEQVLTGAALALDRREFIERVLVPLMHTVGDLWADGNLHVAQEHATSSMVRSQLGALLRLFRSDPAAPLAVATTPAGELHEFGALLAAITAAMAGFRVVYLGPNLPADEIASSVRMGAADAVLLSVVSLEPDLARNEIIAVSERLPPHVHLVLGGRGTLDLAAELPLGVVVARDLTGLEQWLAGRMGDRMVS